MSAFALDEYVGLAGDHPEALRHLHPPAVLVASGEHTADAVAVIVEGSVIARRPDSVLQFHRSATIVVGQAASKLELDNGRSLACRRGHFHCRRPAPGQDLPLREATIDVTERASCAGILRVWAVFDAAVESCGVSTGVASEGRGGCR